MESNLESKACASTELPHAEDKYDGVIIAHDKLPEDVNIFTERLTFSLGKFK